MSEKAIVLLAEGFEEVEAIIPVDFLRRCEVEVIVAGLGSLEIKGAHDLRIKADKVFSGEEDLPDVVILPGGSPGAENLAASHKVRQFLLKMNDEKKLIAAICASPALVLSPAEILRTKRATCYPGLEKNFTTDIEHSKDDVVEDGHVLTGRGPGTAFAFSKRIAEILAGKEKASLVADMMLLS